MLGEVALREVARDATYVILRPTAISTLEDVLVTSTWSLPTKIWRGYRHSHRIFMDDVVHAIQYFLAEALSGRVHHPGRLEAYNLSNDDVPGYSYGAVLRAAYAKTGRREFWCPMDAPGWLDVVKDLIKFRSTRLRYPIGMLYFSPEKLYATGYRHKLGVKEAHRRLLEQLS
jgi:hypothetical protein